MQAIAHRLLPHLSQLCVHKLGSQIVYKLVNQVSEDVAQEMILAQLEHHLTDILSDQVRGLVFIQKLIACPSLKSEQRRQLSTKVCTELEQLNGPGHKKLLALLLDNNGDNTQ
jgi:hypothetical protein